jgi:hypothetical protein
MKSGNLNFLEPSGPLQVCNGTALILQYLLEAPAKQTFVFGVERFHDQHFSHLSFFRKKSTDNISFQQLQIS